MIWDDLLERIRAGELKQPAKAFEIIVAVRAEVWRGSTGLTDWERDIRRMVLARIHPVLNTKPYNPQKGQMSDEEIRAACEEYAKT